MNLLIIGNGFDLGCGLRTSYSTFGDWMESNHQEIASYFYEMGLVNLHSQENESLWMNFENALSCIVPNDIADYSLLYQEKLNNLDDYLKEFIEFAQDEVEIEKKFMYLLSDFCGVILSFNYTQTPNKVGYVGEVIHIHGTLDTEVVIGHNRTIDFSDPEGDYFMSLYELAEEELGNPYRIDELSELCGNISGRYLKNFEDNYTAAKRKIGDLEFDKIIVCGHSYNDIDRRYFEYINEDHHNAQWIFTIFEDGGGNETRAREYEKLLGFRLPAKYVKYTNIFELYDYFKCNSSQGH